MNDDRHVARRKLPRSTARLPLFAALAVTLMAFAGWQAAQAVAAGGHASSAVPASARGTGVVIDLSGPATTAHGSIIQLQATPLDSLKYGGGDRLAVLSRETAGSWRRIASKAVVWQSGGSVGHVTFSLKAGATGLTTYRVSWKNPGGVTRSNVWRVEVE